MSRGRAVDGQISPCRKGQSDEFSSFTDMLKKLMSESTTAMRGDRKLRMSKAEAVIRVLVSKALRGDDRALIKLLRLMVKYPKLSETHPAQVILFINGALARV